MAERITFEGDGLTRRRKVIKEPDQPDARSLLDKLKALAAAPDPWTMNATLFEDIRRRDEEARAAQPDHSDKAAWKSYYEPRVTAAWYLREMRQALDAAELNRSQGSWGWAMYHAMKFGELHTEAQIKFSWEPVVLPLLEVNRRQREANKPLMPNSERVRIVEMILAERARGAADAIRVAASRYPDGGSVSSFRKAWFDRKKAV